MDIVIIAGNEGVPGNYNAKPKQLRMKRTIVGLNLFMVKD